MNWILASGNKGKVKEIQARLVPLGITLTLQSAADVQEVEETGTTFVENAIIKARHAAKVTGLPAIADDSGIAIDALSGQPGVYSARYAGQSATDQDNIDKCLVAMQTIPDAARTAHYYCVIVAMKSFDDPAPIICEGRWSGHILTHCRGTGGFGYDPIFRIDGRVETAAEINLDLKNQISHRGQALTQLVERLQQHSEGVY